MKRVVLYQVVAVSLLLILAVGAAFASTATLRPNRGWDWTSCNTDLGTKIYPFTPDLMTFSMYPEANDPNVPDNIELVSRITDSDDETHVYTGSGGEIRFTFEDDVFIGTNATTVEIFVRGSKVYSYGNCIALVNLPGATAQSGGDLELMQYPVIGQASTTFTASKGSWGTQGINNLVAHFRTGPETYIIEVWAVINGTTTIYPDNLPSGWHLIGEESLNIAMQDGEDDTYIRDHDNYFENPDENTEALVSFMMEDMSLTGYIQRIEIWVRGEEASATLQDPVVYTNLPGAQLFNDDHKLNLSSSTQNRCVTYLAPEEGWTGGDFENLVVHLYANNDLDPYITVRELWVTAYNSRTPITEGQCYMLQNTVANISSLGPDYEYDHEALLNHVSNVHAANEGRHLDIVGTTPLIDRYTMTTTSLGGNNATRITVYVRARKNQYTTGSLKAAIGIGSDVSPTWSSYKTFNYVTTSFSNKYVTFTGNWSQEQIDSLKIKLRGVCGTGAYQLYEVDQLWAVVTY